MEWTSEINRDPAAGNLIPRLDLCPARGNNLSFSLSLVGTLRVTYSPSLLRPKEAFACLPAERRQRNRVGQTLWNTARFIAREVAANRIQILDSAHLSLSLSLSLSLFLLYLLLTELRIINYSLYSKIWYTFERKILDYLEFYLRSS